MSKKYALIEGYGKMIVPISLLEKVTSQCYMGSTRWTEEGGEVLTEVGDIGKVLIIDKMILTMPKYKWHYQEIDKSPFFAIICV